jgi:hypothetical protein
MDEQLQTFVGVALKFTRRYRRYQPNQSAVRSIFGDGVVEQVPLGPIFVRNGPAALLVPIVYELPGAI